MWRPTIDITWQRFGRLTALYIDQDDHTYRRWKCDCWNIKRIKKYYVTRTPTKKHRVVKSCWCLLYEYSRSQFRLTHWLTNTHFYRKRDGMQWRCNRPTHLKYNLRWGKWIKCLWKSFIEFKDDMYESYLMHVKQYGEKQTTLDRINSNGHYYKDNCRWSTYKEQNNNLSTNTSNQWQ